MYQKFLKCPKNFQNIGTKNVSNSLEISKMLLAVLKNTSKPKIFQIFQKLLKYHKILEIHKSKILKNLPKIFEMHQKFLKQLFQKFINLPKISKMPQEF